MVGRTDFEEWLYIVKLKINKSFQDGLKDRNYQKIY
jgi:hypothetical protein